MNRDVADVIADIATDRFAAVVNVASDDRTAATIALAQPETQKLAAVVQSQKGEAADELLRQLAALAKRPINVHYQSPWDVALLTMLLVLERAAPDFIQFAAAVVAGAPNTFWGGRKARRILSAPPRVDAQVLSYGYAVPGLGSTRDAIVVAPVSASLPTYTVGSFDLLFGQPGARPNDEEGTLSYAGLFGHDWIVGQPDGIRPAVAWPGSDVLDAESRAADTNPQLLEHAA